MIEAMVAVGSYDFPSYGDHPDLLALVIVTLVAYRFAAFFVEDEVPFGSIRRALFEWSPPTKRVEVGGGVYEDRPRSATFVFHCMSCMTVWTSLPFWYWWHVAPNTSLRYLFPFAIMGGARLFSRR